MPLGLARRLREELAHSPLEDVEIERLEQEDGAEVSDRRTHRRRVMARDHDDGSGPVRRTQALEDVEATEYRHVDVGDQEVEVLG